MDLFSSTVVSVFLLLAAAGLMFWHVRAWRHAQAKNLDETELDFRRRQFRRRIQTSALLGVLAAALFIGQFITGPNALLFIYWGIALLLVAWVALLAVVDALATKFHFTPPSREVPRRTGQAAGRNPPHPGGPGERTERKTVSSGCE